MLPFSPLELHILPRQVGQRGGYVAVARDELAVVSADAEECAHVPLVAWLRPLVDRLDLVLLHTDASFTDHVAKERHLPLEELALVRVGYVALLQQSSHHPLHELRVFLRRLGIDEDVVHEDHYTSVQLVAQHTLHLSLEHSGCVLHAEGHIVRLVKAQWGRHGQHLLAGFLHRDLPEAFRQIQLAE